MDDTETGLWDRLEAFQKVSAELAGAQGRAHAAALARELALELTGASVAFIGMVDDAGARQQVFSRVADSARPVASDEIDRLFAAAAGSSPDSGRDAYYGLPLRARGKGIGMMGVAGGNIYTVVQRRSLALLANQVAAALAIFRLQQRREGPLAPLVTLAAATGR